MPRYFFRVMEVRATIDSEGTELAGVPEARAQAIRTAGRILSDKAGQFWKGRPWHMTVTDANDETVFTPRFWA